MPTEEEFYAIVALAKKAQNVYGSRLDTQKQYDLVMSYAGKWFDLKEYNAKRANEWNKSHIEAHREHNKRYAQNNREKVREYQRKYYREVLKQKRAQQKQPA